MHGHRPALVAMAVVLIIACAPPATAHTYGYHDWQGAGTGGKTATDPADPTTQWGNPANWSMNYVPHDGGSLTFSFRNAGAVYAKTGLARDLDVLSTTPDAAFYITEGVDFVVTRWAHIGGNHAGQCVQTGGTFSALEDLRMACGHDLGATTYELRGGRLSAPTEHVGWQGYPGVLTQTGGTNTVTRTLYLDSWEAGRGAYELRGGLLDASYEALGTSSAALFDQTSGVNHVGFLSIGANSSYRHSGGTLAVQAGLELKGTLEMTGSASLLADDAIVNLGGGTVVTDGAATLALGPNSLLVVPAGFDPQASFGSYSNQGMLHAAGQPLRVGPNQGFSGQGTIDDRVETSGVVTSRPAEGINLKGGVVVTGGRTDLGAGCLTVDGASSGLSDGELLTSDSVVGTSGNGTFVQTGGTHTVQAHLVIGQNETSSGSYELHGGALRTCDAALNWSATLTQDGGDHAAARVRVGGGGTGVYVLSGGSLVATDSENIGGWGIGTFTQSGGTNTTKTLVMDKWSTSGTDPVYTLSGGQLRADHCELSWGVVRQSAGSSTVGYLEIGKGGRYEFAGGELAVTAGIQLEGPLDLGGTDLAIGGDGLIVTLAPGAVLNAHEASLHLGPASLLIIPPGYDPAADLGHWTNEGITHTQGEPLVIEAGAGFRGSGTVSDHVRTAGIIAANPGGEINLLSGITITGGTVDLGNGTLVVAAEPSTVLRGTVNADQVSIRDWGSLTQKGGTLTATFAEMTGTYKLQGGSLITGTQTGTDQEVIDGTFLQSGGTHRAYGPVWVGRYESGYYHQSGGEHIVHSLYLTPDYLTEGGECTYFLSDGVLAVETDETIGSAFRSTFTQTGGTHTVAGTLWVGGGYPSFDGARASFMLGGGSLVAGDLAVGSDPESPYDAIPGRLAIAGHEPYLEVRGAFILGDGASLTAGKGATVHMTGSAFANRATHDRWLAELENLALVFEGGPNHWATFEVAGRDLGMTTDGFLDNFTLGGLVVGGVQPATLRLEDLFDNTGTPPNEALYLHDLAVLAGSTLDLAGLNVYYDGTFTGEGLILNGAPVFVPEPATLALLALGAAAALRRRRA